MIPTFDWWYEVDHIKKYDSNTFLLNPYEELYVYDNIFEYKNVFIQYYKNEIQPRLKGLFQRNGSP